MEIVLFRRLLCRNRIFNGLFFRRSIVSHFGYVDNHYFVGRFVGTGLFLQVGILHGKARSE